MCIEIKVKQAKSFLDTKYNSKYNNKFSKLKYNHSLDCLNILKYYNYYNYLSYGSAVLLHDIGRFYEQQFKNKSFDHARYGYTLLKEKFTNKPEILLPIKYHEEDLRWKELLLSDKEFLKCSWLNKVRIIKGCKLVRDIDIISNMKMLSKQKNINKKTFNINKKIIEKLYSEQVGCKDNIYNKYDEISYILCGLNLISFKRSFKYIRKHKIINQLKLIQLNMVSCDEELYKITEKMYDFINNKFKV